MSSRTDLLVRISELYYQQNLSQQDISKITGISRPTISRLLDEAKETGVVEIIVHSPINKNPQLSHLVRTTFGLRDAVIVAGDYEFDQSLTRCAHCAVDFLSTVLENNMSIGISWGRALEALCDVLEPTDYSDYYNVTVVQMVGCLGTGNPRVDGLELALRLSKKVHGTYSNIYAPVYVDSELVYSYLTAEPQIEATLKKAGTVDIILTGIGSLNDANGSLYKSGCYNAEERKELMRRGAVSSLLGRMFDINGNEVQLDSRYVISCSVGGNAYSVVVDRHQRQRRKGRVHACRRARKVHQRTGRRRGTCPPHAGNRRRCRSRISTPFKNQPIPQKRYWFFLSLIFYHNQVHS